MESRLLLDETREVEDEDAGEKHEADDDGEDEEDEEEDEEEEEEGAMLQDRSSARH